MLIWAFIGGAVFGGLLVLLAVSIAAKLAKRSEGRSLLVQNAMDDVKVMRDADPIPAEQFKDPGF